MLARARVNAGTGMHACAHVLGCTAHSHTMLVTSHAQKHAHTGLFHTHLHACSLIPFPLSPGSHQPASASLLSGMHITQGHILTHTPADQHMNACAGG